MNKTLKILLIGVIVVIACYFAYFIFAAVKYSHLLDWENTPKKYLWLLKDSAKNKLDSNFSFSYIQKHDVYNHYIYDDIYYITIWKFFDIKSLDSQIEDSVNLDDIKFSSGEILKYTLQP